MQAANDLDMLLNSPTVPPVSPFAFQHQDYIDQETHEALVTKVTMLEGNIDALNSKVDVLETQCNRLVEIIRLSSDLNDMIEK